MFLLLHYIIWVDAGELLVPEDIILPVIRGTDMTYYMYILLKLTVPKRVIINKTNVILPKV